METVSGSERVRKPWTHRPYQEDDLAGVAELREDARILAEGSERRSGAPDYYRWKLRKNPAAPGLLEVALSPEGQVVGAASLTPRRILFDGVVRHSAEIGDTFTSPAYQRQGIFSTLVRTLVAGGSDRGIEFIYGTPNDASLPGYEAKLDFAQIPGAAVQGLVRPLRATRVLRRRLRRGWVGATAAGVVGPLVTVGYRVAFPPSRVAAGLDVRRGPEPPKEAQALFETVKAAYRWIMVRDERYMAWRFQENPDAYDFLSAYRGDALAGYLILKRGRWNGLEVLYFADFLAADSHAFGALVGEALRGAPWADMVSAWTGADGLHADVLRRAGFLRYGRVPVICHRSALGQSVATGSKRWHFTLADSDNI